MLDVRHEVLAVHMQRKVPLGKRDLLVRPAGADLDGRLTVHMQHKVPLGKRDLLSLYLGPLASL
jgi:hypothetical protein